MRRSLKLAPKLHFTSSDSPSASSTELLEVSGIDSKDSFPKTVQAACGLPKELACRRPPAAGPPAAIEATGSAIILIFLN